MSTEQNKAIARRIPLEILNTGNVALVDELVGADFINHSSPPGWPQGRENVKQYAAFFRSAFSDYQASLEDEIAEGDRIVHRSTVRGTHTGELLGIPATGKQATWTEIHVVRMADGKMVEHWGDLDMLSILRQLGVIPATAER